MRVAVLTETTGYAVRALTQLGLRGIAPSAVVIASRGIPTIVNGTVTKMGARPARAVVSGALRRLAALLDSPRRTPAAPQFDGFSDRVISTGPLNSPPLYRALEEVEPDLLLLTATGLVDETVLSIPRVGTLNAHPGLLPWVRGNGAVDQAIRRGVPVGVSIHYVDKGIDTGDMLWRQLVPVTPTDTLSSLCQKAEELRWILAAEIVRQFVCGTPPRRMPQSRRLPLCRWPSSAERADAKRLVTDGEAYRRYCAWRDLANGDLLPQDDAMFHAAVDGT